MGQKGTPNHRLRLVLQACYRFSGRYAYAGRLTAYLADMHMRTCYHLSYRYACTACHSISGRHAYANLLQHFRHICIYCLSQHFWQTCIYFLSQHFWQTCMYCLSQHFWQTCICCLPSFSESYTYAVHPKGQGIWPPISITDPSRAAGVWLAISMTNHTSGT